MKTREFEVLGVRLRVHEETIEDALDIDMLSYEMGIGTTKNERYKRGQFLRLVQLTDVVSGAFAFAWPDKQNATDATLLTAYEGWKPLPGDVIRTWLRELELVNASPNNPDLTPAVSEKKETIPTS